MVFKTLDTRQQRAEISTNKRQKANAVSPVMAQLNVRTRHRGHTSGAPAEDRL